MSKKNDTRRDEITKIILSKEEVSVIYLSNKLKVSAETIRSDLTFLEEKGVLYRTHGGARLRYRNAILPMDIRMRENIDAKKAIAYAAISLIKDDSTIYMDPSSTALPLGRLLRMKKNLTIVTNSYELIPIIAESEHKLIILGGEFYRSGKRMIGPVGIKMVQNIHFDFCILGMDGSQNLNGPAIVSFDEAQLNHTVIKNSNTKIL